jgi:tetratricopeptide (TPR) repeat protein
LFREQRRLFVILEEYEEAITSYDKALQFKPDKDSAWYNRGVALFNLGRYGEAITCYDKVLQIKPDNYSAWYNKACCYTLQSNHEDALSSLSRAIELNPEKYREMVKTDLHFESIRENKRFKALVLG